MSEQLSGFYAYPGYPSSIGETIENSLSIYLPAETNVNIKSWKSLDIIGHFISQEVLSKIDSSDFLIADISLLNFNVTYEIGYAIGKNKPILLTKNKSLLEAAPTIREVGIFDTLGYSEYQNSAELVSLFEKIHHLKPLEISNKIDKQAPVYLLVGKHKTDMATRITARIKKTKYIFRTFDPSEQARLSASDAIHHVSISHGVVIPLLDSHIEGYEVNNMRGAFLAGLADGMGKVLSILQYGEGPVPIDYRDFVSTCKHPKDVDEYIAEFASSIAEQFQSVDKTNDDQKETLLQSLDLGSSSAENEMRSLERYYLKTDQFLKSIRGEAHIVVGRKGSGKSAIFLQIRDRERNKNANIVLDLKPDGYKLIKFKELILKFLEEGTFQHTIMAFWEYVLLLEICYKILETDRKQHINNNNLYEPYRKIADLYHADGYSTEGDFSERMSSLMEKITTEYRSKYGSEKKIQLSVSKLTELLYSHDVKKLTETVREYMRNKNTLWLLFDNIDKGWPTSGLQHEDMLIIRALIDATRKIERQFDRSNVEVNSIIFLRNDVYELLVKETSDRGKEAKVLLDWTDPDLLRELIRLRIRANGINGQENFHSLWSKICISHYHGEESSQYLIDRSLMRPRFLLDLINQCKSYAVNLHHDKIQTDDIEKGLAAFSTDLLTDIGYEIRDVASEIEDDVLYAFINSQAKLSKNTIIKLLQDFGSPQENTDQIFDILLWYGFLGVDVNNEAKYIYDFNYNMQLLRGLIKKQNSSIYLINPAFWAGLMIEK